MILHGYWRSSAAYRVRIALNLKGIAYTQATHDLRTAEHREPAYAALNPQRLVPALDIGNGIVITQSGAIIEWLEATCPDPPLLPVDPVEAAQIRAIAAVVACDIHPLNNLRVLGALREDFGASDAQSQAWIHHWIGDGFAAIEPMIARHGDGFAFGATPTIADCHLVPQVYSAERFGVDLTPYPRLTAAVTRARDLPTFAAAHPSVQPDAD